MTGVAFEVACRQGRCNLVRFLMAMLLTVSTVGCGAAGEVTGDVAKAHFAIRDNSPTLHEHAGSPLKVVMAEARDGQLRVVSLLLPESLEPGESFTLSGESTEAGITVVKGALKTEHVGDVKVLTTSSQEVYPVVSGTVTVESVRPVLAGVFNAELHDGGRLSGRFVVDRD